MGHGIGQDSTGQDRTGLRRCRSVYVWNARADSTARINMKNMQSLRRRRRRHLRSSISYAPSCLFVSFFFFFFFVFFFTFFPRHSSRCNIAGAWRPALVPYLPSILSPYPSLSPFGCCVFCITKCKLILLLQARGRGRYVAFLLVARMKFNGFHFVVVCNDPRATPRQHAMPVWGGAEQTARRGRGGEAMQNISCCFAM